MFQKLRLWGIDANVNEGEGGLVMRLINGMSANYLGGGGV